MFNRHFKLARDTAILDWVTAMLTSSTRFALETFTAVNAGNITTTVFTIFSSSRQLLGAKSKNKSNNFLMDTSQLCAILLPSLNRTSFAAVTAINNFRRKNLRV